MNPFAGGQMQERAFHFVEIPEHSRKPRGSN